MIEGILLENALEEILKRADRITDTKKVKVEEANGFCLAEDIYAELDNPPFPRSPVDGYALRSEDIRGAVRGNPAVLKVAETSRYVYRKCFKKGTESSYL